MGSKPCIKGVIPMSKRISIHNHGLAVHIWILPSISYDHFAKVISLGWLSIEIIIDLGLIDE
jgi:hypothetical protein